MADSDTEAPSMTHTGVAGMDMTSDPEGTGSVALRRRALLAGSAALLPWAATVRPARAATPADTVLMARTIDDLISLDPQESFEAGGGEVVGNVYETLVAPDPADPGKAVGVLAESWSMDETGQAFTIKLRPGRRFASGKPVTASDVAFSLTRAVLLNKPPAFIVNQFGFTPANVAERITAPDPLTVVLRFGERTAAPFLLACLGAAVASIVERDAALAHANGEDQANAWLKTNSAGSGPWALRAWRASESVVLDRNPYHNPHYPGASKLRRFVILHRPDPAAQLLGLQKGDLDIARNLQPEQIRAAGSDPQLEVRRFPRASVLYVGMNTAHPQLAKQPVRQAIKWAIDYHAVAENVVPGLYEVQQSFLPHGFPAALDENPFRKDIPRARALMAEAGAEGGFELTLDHPNNGPLVDVAQAVQADLAAIGISLRLLAAEARGVFTKVRARSYELAMLGWGSDYMDPHSNAETFCVNADNGPDARSRTIAWQCNWQDRALGDAAMAALRIADPDARAAAYRQIQRDHQARSPMAVMLQANTTVAVRRGVTGLDFGPVSNLLRWGAVGKG